MLPILNLLIPIFAPPKVLFFLQVQQFPMANATNSPMSIPPKFVPSLPFACHPFYFLFQFWWPTQPKCPFLQSPNSSPHSGLKPICGTALDDEDIGEDFAWVGWREIMQPKPRSGTFNHKPRRASNRPSAALFALPNCRLPNNVWAKPAPSSYNFAVVTTSQPAGTDSAVGPVVKWEEYEGKRTALALGLHSHSFSSESADNCWREAGKSQWPTL